MSLRQINKERNSGESIFDKLLSFRKKSHFGKLKKKRGLSKPETLYRPNIREPKEKNNILPIVIIVVVAIAVIGFEYWLWSSNQEVSPETGTPFNDTINQTPLVVDEIPEIKKPDLDLSSLTLSTDEANIGEIITITASIRNKGNLNATNFTVEFLIGVLSIGKENVEFLAQDERIDVSINWTVIEDALGKQNLRVFVDPDNVVDEEIETNNEDGKTLDVSEKIYDDLTGEFKYMSVKDFNEKWYSHKFQYAPKSGEGYKYFQISKGESSNIFYLDVAVSGIRAVTTNSISRLEVQDASISGWNGYQCLKKSQDADNCIWNGPLYVFTIDFDDGELIITDNAGTEEDVKCTDRKVDEIELEGMQIADWPDEELRTFRVTNAAIPDYLVPVQFYDYVDDRIYLYPVRWNPSSLNAQVALWARFKITTD